MLLHNDQGFVDDAFVFASHVMDVVVDNHPCTCFCLFIVVLLFGSCCCDNVLSSFFLCFHCSFVVITMMSWLMDVVLCMVFAFLLFLLIFCFH